MARCSLTRAHGCRAGACAGAACAGVTVRPAHAPPAGPRHKGPSPSAARPWFVLRCIAAHRRCAVGECTWGRGGGQCQGACSCDEVWRARVRACGREPESMGTRVRVVTHGVIWKHTTNDAGRAPRQRPRQAGEAAAAQSRSVTRCG